MNKKIIRTIAYLLTAVMAAGTLSACQIVPSLEISDEERTLIAEYAAGKLIEYVKGHPGGLVQLEDIDYSEVNPGLKQEEEPAAEALPEQLPGTPADEEATFDDGSIPPPDQGENPSDEVTEQEALVDAPEESSVPTKSTAQALGIDGAELVYDHFEISDSYPENASELALSMKATTGKELLIVHFSLYNPGSEDVIVHTDSNNFKVRAILNDSDKLRGDITFLDNDLMNYEGLLTPGSAVDAVLVFEMPEGTQIESLDLLIIDDEGEQNYTLV